MRISKFSCKECGHNLSNQCALSHQPVEENDICGYYTENPIHCEICGDHLISQQVIITAGDSTPYHILCANCYEYLGACQTCTLGNICSFRQDSSIKEPPVILQTIREGNTVIQTQIKNPARIKLTCEKCSCYREGNCCKEEISRCESYHNNITGW